jgi:beta-glucanase (GH16 family)
MDVLEGLSGSACYHFHSSSGGPGGCAGVLTGWHVFGALWQKGSVTYYYDGRQVGRITTGITGSPMYLILNHAVGGCCAGPKLVPTTVYVDYVHVYSNASGAVAVSPQPNYGGPGATG